MPNYANEGDKVRMKDGSMAIVKGGRLVALPGQGGGTPAPKMSYQTEKFLNELRGAGKSAEDVGQLYDRAEGSIDRLRPGPYRNSLLLAPSIPEDQGGFWDKFGAATLGTVARGLGAVTEQEVNDYQTLRGLQSGTVLDKQLAQKGPQTESDAARLMLTEISPGKSEQTNREIIQAGRDKINRERARVIFYTQWVRKYGLNGVNERGRTADQVWSGWGDKVVEQLFGGETKGSSRPVIRKVR